MPNSKATARLSRWLPWTHDYLNRAAAAGMVWPLGEEWDEQRVELALFGERQVVKRLSGRLVRPLVCSHIH
jgi:hypothetical protein